MIQIRSEFAFMNDTPYLNLTGELWGVFREIFKENRERTALGIQQSVHLLWRQFSL